MTVYQRGHVTIDDHFARFGAKSYAINKITSVEVREQVRSGSAWVVFGVMAGIFIFAGLGMLGDEAKPDKTSAIGMALLGLGLLVPAVLTYRSRISRTYQLMLATAAGEVQATTSTNGEAIGELREALERQIVARG